MLPPDNLQEIVDSIREDLSKGQGGSWQIGHPDLETPMLLDIRVDGVNAWLVKLACGEQVVFDTGYASSVKPEEFVNKLYVFLRAAINTLTHPPASQKPS